MTLLAMKTRWGFAIGFAIGLLIFVSANVMSYRQMLRGSELSDVTRSFGFPFTLYAASGFGGEWIVWSGLIEDIFIAVGASTFLGSVGRLVFNKRTGLQDFRDERREIL